MCLTFLSIHSCHLPQVIKINVGVAFLEKLNGDHLGKIPVICWQWWWTGRDLKILSLRNSLRNVYIFWKHSVYYLIKFIMWKNRGFNCKTFLRSPNRIVPDIHDKRLFIFYESLISKGSSRTAQLGFILDWLILTAYQLLLGYFMPRVSGTAFIERSRSHIFASSSLSQEFLSARF